jgi:hypothetical protein
MDPPVLKINQPISIPPLYILEAQYPGVIHKNTAVPEMPPPGVIQKTTAVPEAPPISVKPQVANKGPASVDTPPPTVKSVPMVSALAQWQIQQTSAGPVYTVQGKDEFVLEVARKALGDEKRWSDIMRLNPHIDTSRPIPVGTQVLLPSNNGW